MHLFCMVKSHTTQIDTDLKRHLQTGPQTEPKPLLTLGGLFFFEPKNLHKKNIVYIFIIKLMIRPGRTALDPGIRP